MPDLTPLLGTRAQRGFLGTVVLQGIVVLTMTGISFGKVAAHVNTGSNRLFRTLPCYFALFILAQLFHIILTFDALNLRNIIQVVGLLIFQACLTIYGGIQIQETRTALVQTPGADCATNYVTCSGPGSLWAAIEPFQIVVPIICGLALGVMIYFTWKLYQEFGWAVFRMVGADPELKDMFRYYQIMIVLLKFDYFAFTGLTMQLLILVLADRSAQFALTIAAIPIVLILLTACGYAVGQEIKWLMQISLTLMLASEAYFIYKFSRLFASGSRHQYDSTRKSLGVFIVASFFLLLATFCVGIKCYLDFDKGLKSSKIREPNSLPRWRRDAMRESKSAHPMSPGPSPDVRATYYTAGEPLRERISIE
ncbi:hypothetical protein BS47DRAFT_1399891 [Hydnum rufescens UP504]|uniref:Uncharacterized protein n=1 Tax=Hydnum rufescens UP504 TaxID=1448309 RepID=A0A9P6AHK5_9AGAM|nr:hypothetical protein BS47DRAFT_1399891 [Hydnum rufescens UP504]